MNYSDLIKKVQLHLDKLFAITDLIEENYDPIIKVLYQHYQCVDVEGNKILVIVLYKHESAQINYVNDTYEINS